MGRFNDMVDGRSVRFNHELYIFLYMQRIFCKKIISVSQFDQKIHRMNLRYPEMVTRAQMNFLDTHDVSRFLVTVQAMIEN